VKLSVTGRDTCAISGEAKNKITKQEISFLKKWFKK